MKKYFVALVLLFGLIISAVCQADSFQVRNIRIEGLQRISPDTVYTYLPIKKGDTLRSDNTGSLIRDLYKTGFFEHINLTREGSTLVIHVIERPTIGQLKISGNKVVPREKLTSVMNGVDVAEGRIFNKVMLERIRQSLLNQYYELGRYNARVDVSVTPMERNRVMVKICISEGLVAVIRRINIIGNCAFTDRQLKRQMTISTPNLFTIVTSNDKYSQEKLDASLESLRNFYLDQGYLRFAIKSSQVEITPDRKSIYVTIALDEGQLYTVKGFDMHGDFVIPKEQLMCLVKVKPGCHFSRQAIVDTEKAISDALGDKGYVYAQIDLQPDINDKCREVFLNFNIKSGRLVYVRHVYFTNNTKTNDVTLRREITQMEAALISTGKLDASKRNLSMQPYIKDVQMSLVPVAGKNDLVDVNYKVTEESAAQANFNIGYSQVNHLILGLGFNQKNFLGTGETFGVNLSRSNYEKDYSMSFTDPYYTLDGVSRSINFSLTQVNPAKAPSLSRSYNSSEFDASVVYGFPLGQEKDVTNRAFLGYGYQSTVIDLTNTVPSNQVTDFINEHGRHYQQLELIAGISRDSRDKSVFPTRGAIQSLGLNIYAPLGGRSLKFYTASYNARGYLPLTEQFILTARGALAYGNAFNGVNNYPFFRNFYCGGIDTVRGYLPFSLGPKDSNARSTGGNMLAAASIALIFPNFISDSLRTSWFVDAGNAYNSFDNRKYGGNGSGPLRYATGLEIDWLSPLGPVNVSFGKALNLRRNPTDTPQLHWGDTEDFFQFSLGTSF